MSDAWDFQSSLSKVLASTDTRGSSQRAERTWSQAQPKSFGKLLPLSCARRCASSRQARACPRLSALPSPTRLPSEELFKGFEKCALPLSEDTPIRSAALCGVQSFSDWQLPSCTRSLAWEAAHWVRGRTEDKSFPWRGWCWH